jgi:2-polyprenyl-3-methyl-5-hydroxy-6-metoxy-1,4-benzoquinol methylase
MSSRPAKEPLLTPWLRDLRIAAVAPYLSGDVLDIGAGSGHLAERVDPRSYYGFDVDAWQLTRARSAFPRHTFSDALPEGRRFDHVIALAVIEHTPDPAKFLAMCARFLTPHGRVVLTTPNPTLEWLHGVASVIGVLSREAHDDHQSVVGHKALLKAAASAGLRADRFRYFMLGANQLLVLSRQPANG